MSILHPETAEDKMAWVPIIGCFVPLIVVGGLLAWWLVGALA